MPTPTLREINLNLPHRIHELVKPEKETIYIREQMLHKITSESCAILLKSRLFDCC